MSFNSVGGELGVFVGQVAAVRAVGSYFVYTVNYRKVVRGLPKFAEKTDEIYEGHLRAE